MLKRLLQKATVEAVARSGSVAKAELFDRLRGNTTLGEVLTRASTGGCLELLAEVRGGDLVDVEQRLTQARVALAIVSALSIVGQRQAELLGEHPHGILKPDLLVQLEKLEHIAALAAPEAMEEALLGIDVE